MARRDTYLMLQAEKRVGMPIIKFLVENYPTLGLVGCADKLGVSKATAWGWISRAGYMTEHRLVPIHPEREAVATERG